MGHHMKRNMEKVRQELDALTLAADGVDGRDIYVYGEGWNFGEVVNGARGEKATQQNMAGTGIGTFNDRIRDAGRGGGAFSGLQVQGFLTGLYVDRQPGAAGTAHRHLLFVGQGRGAEKASSRETRRPGTTRFSGSCEMRAMC